MTTDMTRAGAEARALQLLLALATRIGWTFARGPMPSGTFAQFLYAEKPQLLLVPTAASIAMSRGKVEPLVRENRADALILSLADTGPPALAFAIWKRSETMWTTSLELWIGAVGDTWLVPGADAGHGFGIRLDIALHRATDLPWTSEAERIAGRLRARAWVARAAPGIR